MSKKFIRQKQKKTRQFKARSLNSLRCIDISLTPGTGFQSF